MMPKIDKGRSYATLFLPYIISMGLATNIEEYVPTNTPIIIAKAKS